MIFDHWSEGDMAPEINNALRWCVANNETLRMGAGSYLCTTQIVVPSGAKWVMDPNTILVKDFAGTVGDRYNNALIRNENAPTGAAVIVDPGPWVPVTTDDDILIEGGRIRHNEATDIGGGVYMMGVTKLTMRGVTVEHSRQDWAFAIGGDDIVLDRLRVEENDLVFEDGIHILYGSRIEIIEPYVNSGDDALAFGTNWNLPISDVEVKGGRVSANKGHALRYIQVREGSTSAFAPPTQKIENIRAIGLRGRAGLVRNGLVQSDIAVISGTAQAGTTLSMTLASNASSANGFYIGGRLAITGGTGTLAQFREIIDYDGTTKVATVGQVWSIAPDATTTYQIEGVLCANIQLVDVSLTGGDESGHDGNNPNGVRIENTRNVTLSNVEVNNSIRDAFHLSKIQGSLILDQVQQSNPQSSSGSFFGVTILDCPSVAITGGRFTRGSANHAISILNSRVTATGVVVLDIGDTGLAAFRVNNGSGNATRLVVNGGSFFKRPGSSASRVVRCDGTGTSYYLHGCDVTDVDQNVFNGSTPSEAVLSQLVPASRNP